jgi:PAS domain S-box-containing protein
MPRDAELPIELPHASARIEPAAGRAERLADLLALSYEPMLARRLDGAIEFWNAGAARLYGFAADEAVGRSSHSLLQTKFPDEFKKFRRQLLNERRWFGELRHVCKDGREVLVDSRMQLLADGTVLEVNRDISEQKKIEDALRDSEQQLRWLASIVESSDDAIVSKNLDGVIRSWNKGAERVFGYTAEEAIGRPITIVIPEDQHSEEVEILKRIRRGERIDHFETIRQRKHGSLIVVSLTVSPVKNAEGKIVGASKVARDITQQRRNQEQITILAREAEHRSKNLLATVQAAVNLSDADTSEGLKLAIRGRVEALANVHSLFVKTRWVGADLETIASQELSAYSEKHGSRLRIAGPPVLLEPDAAQAVAIVLHELVTNAVKYGALSAAGGNIDLSWSQKANEGLNLRWQEAGGPPVQVPKHKGFGSRVIERMIKQLKGKTHFDWRGEGLVCEITLPM